MWLREKRGRRRNFTPAFGKRSSRQPVHDAGGLDVLFFYVLRFWLCGHRILPAVHVMTLAFCVCFLCLPFAFGFVLASICDDTCALKLSP